MESRAIVEVRDQLSVNDRMPWMLFKFDGERTFLLQGSGNLDSFHRKKFCTPLKSLSKLFCQSSFYSIVDNETEMECFRQKGYIWQNRFF